ncbi:glycosyltransferase family 9 protein [Acerihabitans arboris]|uniref:Lipopolysaccharide heptosyltransferase family protein n=1 Tax=Acerihabitans arboris TaxID=2691583 RepID=A0A845SIQ2_9GAMM|nr:glycosyltransferase family 9 protein [Acerihabitans arboris]NDL64790.1 lipopolysaccharide heptosyltransferase family protein [Acerihabitans arboris]
MSYVILFFLLLPIKFALKPFQKHTGRNLIIQTAKIGDFVNITPLLQQLGRSDALLSRTVGPLASRDNTLADCFFIEEYKSGFLKKMRLAFMLINRYSNVYLLQPNSTNLFYAAVCNARNKQFLTVYTRKWYHGIFYLTASGCVEHRRDTLSLENYLKLADRALTWRSQPKHATQPLWQPQRVLPMPDAPGKIKIGISISAGNKAKTIPAAVWGQILATLASLPCVFYIFGPQDEQRYLDEFYQVNGGSGNVISLVGQLQLEEIPYAVSRMDCYIASDSGNIYIADSQRVPVICLSGPCCMAEQRPLGQTLIISPADIKPSSFVFSAPYHFEHSPLRLFALTQANRDDIFAFVAKLSHKEVING